MRRFNPGRPCCKVCFDSCFIPAYKPPPYSDLYDEYWSSLTSFAPQLPNYFVDYWYRMPSYKLQDYANYVRNVTITSTPSQELDMNVIGEFGGESGVVVHPHIIYNRKTPSNSGIQQLYTIYHHEFLSNPDNGFILPRNYQPPPVYYDDPINHCTVSLIFRDVAFTNAGNILSSLTLTWGAPTNFDTHGRFRNVQTLISSRNLSLISTSGNYGGIRQFIYESNENFSFIQRNSPSYSGYFPTIYSPDARLIVNVDESLTSQGTVPSGRMFTYRTQIDRDFFNNPVFNFTTISGDGTQVFYNSTLSPSGNKSKFYLTIMSTGLVPHTGYFECGAINDNDSVIQNYETMSLSDQRFYSVIQYNIFYDIPDYFINQSLSDYVDSTYINIEQKNNPQLQTFEKMSKKTRQTTVSYSKNKGYWRFVRGWVGTIDNVIESGIRSFYTGNPQFPVFVDWNSYCPYFEFSQYSASKNFLYGSILNRAIYVNFVSLDNYILG